MPTKLEKIRKKIEAHKVSGIGNADKLRKQFFEEVRKAKKK